MKKANLLLLAITTITSYCHAQGGSDQPQFGIKGGVNLSNVYDAQGEEFEADAKFGLVAGVFVAIPFGSLLGFHPELLYSQKGFKATGRVLGSEYEFTRTLNYLDIPLLFAIKPTRALTLLIGPQYSYLMSQKDEFNNEFISDTQTEEFNNENIRKNTLCFLGGVDLNLDQIVLGGRVGWDVTKNNGDGTSETPRYKNVWYQLTIGFRCIN